MAKRPGGMMVQGTDATQSQLIPVLTKWDDIGKKAQLWPAIFCIATFFALYIFDPSDLLVVVTYDQGKPVEPMGWIYTSWYLIVLGLFLTMVSLFFIYKQVGKNKSWWVLFLGMGFTAYFLWLFRTQGYFGWLYDFFHTDLAGGEADASQSISQLFMRHFLGTGFFEEFTKAIPILFLAWWTPKMTATMRTKIGVEEPLDGILIGAASGGGFAIVETLGQYVPNILTKVYVHVALSSHGFTGDNAARDAIKQAGLPAVYEWMLQAGNQVGTALAVPNLLTRSIDLAFGHMAYSGYFGYFIGLAVLKPEQKWKILGIGLVSASIPHALWDTFAQKDMTLMEAVTAILAYAILAAAILKAREISPNRNLLQPSVLMSSTLVPAGVSTPVILKATPVVNSPAPAPYASPQPVMTGMPAPSGAGNRLRVGSRYLVIAPGLRLLPHQVPGLEAQAAGGAVAEVTRNPGDPSVLGLTNLSTTAWETVSGSGARRQITSGQTIKLAPGTRIDFGSTDGEVG